MQVVWSAGDHARAGTFAHYLGRREHAEDRDRCWNADTAAALRWQGAGRRGQAAAGWRENLARIFRRELGTTRARLGIPWLRTGCDTGRRPWKIAGSGDHATARRLSAQEWPAL